jgi:hypothetical protein
MGACFLPAAVRRAWRDSQPGLVLHSFLMVLRRAWREDQCGKSIARVYAILAHSARSTHGAARTDGDVGRSGARAFEA